MKALEKPLEKSDPKNWKNSKNQSEISASKQTKPLSRKRIFVQTPFSHYTLKLERKNSHRKINSFWLHFLFRRDQNHYCNLTSKIIKMCEQILKTKPEEFRKWLEESFWKNWLLNELIQTDSY